MIIYFIGKFDKLHNEEYIAQAFEGLGHKVIRAEEALRADEIIKEIQAEKPDIVLFIKLRCQYPERVVKYCRDNLIQTVCWVFDLYWNYSREFEITKHPRFKADYVITTDGGNEHRWISAGINHRCVRQGIHAPECVMLEGKPEIDVVFVGTDSPVYPERTQTIKKVATQFPNFKWYGREDTEEIRGMDLNKLFAKAKIVIGDSFPSDNYWSNRVVETLGRGGFLIHRYVKGIKDEYPNLVTYDGSLQDLFLKIEYYLSHDKEREEIRKLNFDLVKSRYTMDKKCQEVLKIIS